MAMIEIRKTEIVTKWMMACRTFEHALAFLYELNGLQQGIQGTSRLLVRASRNCELIMALVIGSITKDKGEN